MPMDDILLAVFNYSGINLRLVNAIVMLTCKQGKFKQSKDTA